jgi:hypothetical protein
MYDAVYKLSQQIDELERVMFSITGAPSINQVEFLRFMSSLSNEDHRELGLLSAPEKISFLVRRFGTEKKGWRRGYDATKPDGDIF